MTKKIGLHTIGGYGGQWGPSPVVKLVDASPEFFGQVRAKVGSKVLMIWRKRLANMPLNDPVANANAFYDQYRNQMIQCQGYGGWCAFSFYNEIPDDLADPYNLAIIQFLKRLHQDGLNGCILDSSVGVPDFPKVIKYTGAVNAMTYGDVIGIHEYWNSSADIDNIYHCGRFSLNPLFMGKDIVITECGQDEVEKIGKPGYKASGKTDDEFIMDLIKYDAILMKYPNVKGAVVFTGGDAIGPEFRDFDVNTCWQKFLQDIEPYQVTPSGTAPGSSTPGIIYEPPMKIVGKCFTEQEAKKYVNSLDYSQWKPTEIWLHHTAVPDLAGWKAEQSIWAMKAYYDKQPWVDNNGITHIGWGSGPHFFVAPEGIWAFTPANQEGSHVIGHNAYSIGIEMVGNYDQVKPSGKILEYTMWLIAVGCRAWGILPGNLRFHRDVSPKTCPGTAVTKPWIIPLVQQAYELSHGMPTEEKATDAKTLVNKIRWWIEERRRWYQLGCLVRADELDFSIIELSYRAENAF